MSPAKILAVDDEADFELLIRQRFRRQIRANEFVFRFAHHGEEALVVLKQEPDIELLLLDINMPVMDGLTLLAELRERQSDVRAIIVSAYGDMTNLRTAMNRGAFDFVTKPVDLNDLEITIRKTLDDIAKTREIDRQRAAAERARTNLSRYFSPNLVAMLADRDEPLGAVRRQTVAVLFVDIVGFTRMAERLGPEAVVTMLRQFHTRMTEEIFACGGTVEKYIGDAIFAVFGLPTPTPEDAVNALRCADLMSAALAAWNIERTQAGDQPLAIGIGLNYGPAVIGDVGSEHSLSFTVIGDTVNTASRLQGLTRSLATPLVVGDALVTAAAAMPQGTTAGTTANGVAELLGALEDRGEQVLRGRSGPVRIWTRRPDGSSAAGNALPDRSLVSYVPDQGGGNS
jgi:adenylate cyclase